MPVTHSLPSTGSHFISLPDAVAMTTRYRNNKELILDSSYRDQNILAISETFERDALDTLLATEGCAGARIYYGMDENLKVHAILVAVDEENNDILPVGAEASPETDADAPIVEEGQRCPDICGGSSPLNP